MPSPFLGRVQDGGSRFVGPGGYVRPNVAMDQYERSKDRRLAISSLLSANNNAMWDRNLARDQFEAEQALKERQFSGGLELDQRRQLLAEAEAEANALLRGRSAEIDELATRGRLDYQNRQMNLAEQAPTDIDLLRERARLESAGIGESGLSSHNKQMHTLQTTKLLEGQVSELRKAMADAPLTADGQRDWGELSGELRSLESQRDTLRPELYNQAMSQLLQKAERMDLRSKVKPPPTRDEIIQSDYDEERGIFIQRKDDGSIEARPLKSAKIEQYEAETARMLAEVKVREAGGSAATVRSMEQIGEKGLEELQNNAKEAIMLRRQMAAEKSGSVASPSEKIEPRELYTEMRRIFDEKQQLMQMIRGEQPPNPGESIPPTTAVQQPFDAGMPMPEGTPNDYLMETARRLQTGEPIPAGPAPQPMVGGKTPNQAILDLIEKQNRGEDIQTGALDSKRPTRPYSKSPGTITPEETVEIKELMNMRPTKRIEKLKELHPMTRGKSFDELLKLPELVDNYNSLVEQGLLKKGNFKEDAIQMLDTFLTEETGVLDVEQAYLGMAVEDLKSPEAKEFAARLPRPKSLSEAKKENSRYFVDPEGVIRQLF